MVSKHLGVRMKIYAECQTIEEEETRLLNHILESL